MSALAPEHRPPAVGSPEAPIEIEVYYDFLCPYAYEAAVWLERAKAELGDGLRVTWRAFPLEQVNADPDLGPDWKLWEQPLDADHQGLLALRAAAAAAEQGDDAFARFHRQVMELRHGQQRTLTRRPSLLRAAAQAGLDLARFERDLDDDALAARIGADYAHGQAEHGVFGTPTFVTPDGDSVYVQVRPAPEPADAVPLLLEVLGIARQRPNVREIKRTKRPAPPEAV